MEITDKLTHNCQVVSNWMESNQLKLNAEKTHILTLGTDRRLQMPGNKVSIVMGGVTLEESNEKVETLLGCQIQANLKWLLQVQKLALKLKKRLVGLNHIKFILILSTRRAISDSMFNSVLVYCLPVFGGCDAQEVKEIQVLQNKAARIVTQSPLRAGRQEIFDQQPEYLASRLSRENRNGYIILPKSNLSLHRNSFGYRAAKDLNCYHQG